MRTVVFDLDGTLADTSGDLIAAANAAFEAMGHRPPLDERHDAATAFAGGRAMLRLGFERLGEPADEGRVDAGYPVLLDAYEQAIDARTFLYPGAERAVAGLRAQGYALGVCTNKPTPLAELLLRRLGLRDSFEALVGAGCLPERKPDPAPYLETVRRLGGDVRRSMLLGDTVTDRDTARAAGVPVALVGFGPYGERVANLEPDAVLAHYDGLADLAARLIAPGAADC